MSKHVTFSPDTKPVPEPASPFPTAVVVRAYCRDPLVEFYLPAQQARLDQLVALLNSLAGLGFAGFKPPKLTDSLREELSYYVVEYKLAIQKAMQAAAEQ